MDYITLYLSARKSLNHTNLDELTAKQIEHMGKMYSEEYFSHFKKSVFFRWFTENSQNTSAFNRKAKRNLKKLNIELSDSDLEKVNNIEPREFTERRALKTIEVPYKDLPEANLLEDHAYFFYKDTRVYRFSKALYRQEHKGEIYFTKNEIVFFDRKNNVINDIINYSIIEEVSLKKYAVEIHVVDEDPVYIRYKDNELIFISLSRSLPYKTNVDFVDVSREESDTIERTIEAILDA